jgi:chemotaxis protein methyltransferase CheR
MTAIAITDQEFGQFQRFILDAAGITLSSAKKALVSGRLAKRLHHHAFTSYKQYLALLQSGQAGSEVQMAVDLLTTNETYFFREPKHFEALRDIVRGWQSRNGQPFRVWSAACSSGEEVYTLAMVLADAFGEGRRGVPGTGPAWEVLGTDISQRVLQQATTGHYPLSRTRGIPPECLRRHCLRGIGEQDGTLLVDRALRRQVRFAQVNLNTTLPDLGSFDAIFLRNVMIYFSGDTKRQVIARVLNHLKPGGHFFIGHSESLNELTTAVTPVAPSIYRKP